MVGKNALALLSPWLQIVVSRSSNLFSDINKAMMRRRDCKNRNSNLGAPSRMSELEVNVILPPFF